MSRKSIYSLSGAVIILVAILLLIIFTGGKSSPNEKMPIPATSLQHSSSTISIAGNVFYVNVADTPEKRTQGLSGTSSLDSNEGMLFIFDMPGKYDFWMYEMNYPLDFVWINNGKVVQLDQRVPAPLNGTPIKTISPISDVDMVLEVNAGTISNDSIKIGDPVEVNY